jgi:hypothetical protein
MQPLLVMLGGFVFLALGTLHGAVSLRDVWNPTQFTPNDPALRLAMQQSGIAFHPEVNLWKAWLGFNLTHSLGLILFGGAFLYVGMFAPGAFHASRALQAVAVSASATYLVISIFFFFSGPAVGTAAGLCAFLIATLL